MRNTKNNTEVQGSGNAQEQFNIATKELFSSIGLDFIKSNYEVLIFAWIGSENCNQFEAYTRSNVYYFNRHFLNFLENISNENPSINLCNEFIKEWDLKTAKFRLHEVYDGFLCTDQSDDLTRRLDGVLLYKELDSYLEKIFNLELKN